MSPTYQLGLCRRGLMSQCGGTRSPNWTTQRAFLLGSWLGPWPPGIRPRRSGQITHWAIIAPSTRDPLGALARELGLAARCSSASWTRPYEWSLVSREGLRRARSCREGPQCVTRPLRVRHYTPAPDLEARQETHARANRDRQHVPWDNCGHMADYQPETRRFRRPPCPFVPMAWI